MADEEEAIEVRTEGTIAETLIDRVRFEAPELLAETDDALERIIEEVMLATSVEELLGQETTDVEDVIGRPYRVEGFRLQEGDFGHYAVIRGAFTDTGERGVVTCGGTRVIAQLFRAHQLQAFPMVVAFGKADTREGFRAFYLTKPAGFVVEA